MNQLGKFFTLCGIAVALMTVAASGALATTWWVSTTGSDGNSGSSGSPFASLAKAVSVCAAGDTISMNGGTYTVSTTIFMLTTGTSSAPITIESTSGQTATLLASNISGGFSDGSDILDLGNATTTVNYINVENIIFNGNGCTNEFECVDQYNCNNCTVSGCTLENGYYGGGDISRYDSSIAVTGDHYTNCTVYNNSTNNTNDSQGDSGNWGGGIGMNNCTNCSINGCTVYDNWGEGLTMAGTHTSTSGNIASGNVVFDNFSVELYFNGQQSSTLANNLVYTTSTSYYRDSYPANSIEIDDEQNLYATQNCSIFNNVLLGGGYNLCYFNANRSSGFNNGGMNGYNVYNNVFYSEKLANGNNPEDNIFICSDSGNNFTWRNNVVWQTINSCANATDNYGSPPDGSGYGAQTISNNCWDYSGGSNNMSGSGDVDFSNANPGLVSPGPNVAADYELTSSSTLNTAGYNAYSLFTYDYNNAARPSSGSWSIGAFVPPGGGSTGNLVQETYNDSSSSGSSVQQAYTSSQAAGDLNVVVIGYNNTTATVSSVTDSAGNTYTNAIGPTTGTLATQYIYYAPNIKGGTNTVTVNLSTTVAYPDVRIAEYKNVNSLDKTAGASGNSTAPNSGSATTTSADEVIVGGCTSGPGVTAAGSGFGDLVVTSPDKNAIEDATVSSTGSYSATCTQSTGNWVMQMATFLQGSPPTAPSDLSATGGNATVALSWTGSSGASSYNVYRGTSSGGESSTAIGSTSNTTYTDSTVSNGTTYYYKVKAVDSYGTSNPSNEASATPTSTTSDFVQGTYNDSSSSGSSVVQAYSSNQTAGDLNVVIIGYNNTSATVSSVTDSAGNTYTKAVGPTVGGIATQYIYYASNIKSGANTVTVNLSTTVAYPDMRILEYKNVGALDVTAASTGNSTSPSSGSATTTAANEVLVGACQSGPGVASAGSGFTMREMTSPDGDAAEDETVTSTGAYTATCSQPTGNWVMQMATFKSAAPTFKQVNSNDPASDTTITCAYNSSQTAGDMNVVVIGCNTPAATISTITDTAGNTYTKAVGITTSGGTMQAIYYAPGIKGGTNSVSVTFNENVAYPDIRVLEYSGISAVDKTASNSGTGTSATTSSVTTSYANEVLFMADTDYPSTTGVGTGFTTRVTTSDGNVASDDIVSATGSYSASASLGGSNYWVIQLVTFH